MTRNRDSRGIRLSTPGQLRTWADDLKRIYSTPIDGSFDDLIRRLDHAARRPHFGKKTRS